LLGSIGEAVTDPNPAIRRLGIVEDLGDVYKQASVVVNPVLIGSGQSIKSVEALAAGRPLVTTACGARGLLAGAGQAYLMADDPADFADCVIQLLKDPARRARLADAARTFARQFNAAQLDELSGLIGERQATAGQLA
jgi:glycosyltransferase involved in cell wall biosynthesis